MDSGPLIRFMTRSILSLSWCSDYGVVLGVISDWHLGLCPGPLIPGHSRDWSSIVLSHLDAQPHSWGHWEWQMSCWSIKRSFMTDSFHQCALAGIRQQNPELCSQASTQMGDPSYWYSLYLYLAPGRWPVFCCYNEILGANNFKGEKDCLASTSCYSCLPFSGYSPSFGESRGRKCNT